ncbi:MAG TPA: hypothetical protein VEX41_09015 [Candidatus Eisenbacteria bacterium]|nr:hypothetical protein [Candidatus Eisenbacteria bacterium]
MSERPETAAIDAMQWRGWGPTGTTPWGPSLWGTTIDYGQGAKVVIDKDGVGRFTDAAGETGVWDPTFEAWVDEVTKEFMDPTFGLPGMERTAEQVEALVARLEALADQTDSIDLANRLRERAQDLRQDYGAD